MEAIETSTTAESQAATVPPVTAAEEATAPPVIETPGTDAPVTPPTGEPEDGGAALEALLRKNTRPPSDDGSQAQEQAPPADEKTAPAKKGKMKFPGDPRKGSAAIINTLELVNMGMGVVIAKDWELTKLDRYKFQPAMKAQAVESWADWVETWEIKTNLLWLPAVLAALGMFGATAFTAFQDRKDLERIAREKEYFQQAAAAAAAGAAAPPPPPPIEPANPETTASAARIFAPLVENRETTSKPGKRTGSTAPKTARKDGAPWSEEESNRTKFEVDADGFYVHHPTTSQYLKKGSRHDRPSIFILEMIQNGMKSAEIRRHLKSWKP